MDLDDYDPSTALSAYYPSRDERRTARVWATEKFLHDMAEVGMVEFFEGTGTNPTTLTGYSTTKLWLRVSSGVTAAPGEVRAYDGSGDATLIASWPVLTRGAFLSFLGVSPDLGRFETRQDVEAATIGVSVNGLTTLGYATVGDGGGALYKRVDTEPTHAGKVQSADGAWWEIAPLGGARININKGTGVVGDGVADDHSALQDALDEWGALQESDGPYPRILAQLQSVPGKYFIGSGKTLRIARGAGIIGAGRTATWFIHGGGDVPLFDTDPGATNNIEIELAGFTAIGAAAGGSEAGLKANNAIRNARVRDVTFKEFYDNVVLNDCWTFNLDRCDLQAAVRYNLRWANATAGTIRDCRIDFAGDHNVYVSYNEDSALDTVNLCLYNSYIQFAQKSGLYIEKVAELHILGGYFEGNNKANAGWAEIHQTGGSPARGEMLSLHGVFGSATTAGGNTTRFIKHDKGDLVMVGCHNYNGGNYDVGLELGANTRNVTLAGCRILANTSRITQSNAATVVNEISDNAGRVLLNKIDPASDVWGQTVVPAAYSRVVMQGLGNFYYELDSPANRRAELRFGSGGTMKWFMGRGDTDESFPDDFYIHRSAGGGATPDFRIDDATGRTWIRLFGLNGIPTYADDAAAASAGLTAGMVYKTSGGELRVKT